MPYKDEIQQKQAQHESYIRNKEEVIERTRCRRRDNYAKMKIIKETAPCTDCGLYYPHYVMDFDHTNPLNKVDKVSNLVRNASWDTVTEEVEKCELVCANCHRIRTYERQQI